VTAAGNVRLPAAAVWGWAAGQPQGSIVRPTYTDSFSSFAGRNAIFLLAAISMDSPVAGFRPIRAGKFRTCRIPRPLRRILSPFLRCSVAIVTRSARTASASGRTCQIRQKGYARCSCRFWHECQAIVMVGWSLHTSTTLAHTADPGGLSTNPPPGGGLVTMVRGTSLRPMRGAGCHNIGFCEHSLPGHLPEPVTSVGPTSPTG
jgi:hypothetical protein